MRPIVYGEESDLLLADVSVHDNTVTVAGSGFEDEETYGTLVGVLQGTLTWSGGEVSANTAVLTTGDAILGGRGMAGLVTVLQGTGELSDVAFHHNVTTVTIPEPDTYGYYWATWVADLYSESSDLAIEGVSFEDEQIDVVSSGYCNPEVSPVVAYNGGSVTGTDLRFERNTITNMGGYTTPSMFLYGPSFELDGVSVTESSADATIGVAAAMSIYASTGTLRHLDVRENVARAHAIPASAGVLNLYPATVTVENFVVAGNTVDSAAWTTLGVIAGYRTTLVNGDIVGNASTGFLPASAVFYSEGSIAGTNLNIVDNTVVDSGYGTYCSGAEIENSSGGGTTLDLTNTNLHGNVSSRWPGVPRTTSSNCTFPALTGTALLDVDPLYIDVTAPSPQDWDLHLQAGSPAIDAGLTSIVDVDASVSDLGAYGGPNGAW